MAFNIVIEPTGTIEVPEDVASDLMEAYVALSGLPVRNQATIDFLDSEEETENKRAARLFVRQAHTWAETQGLKFIRKGDISGNPTRVSFRFTEIKDSEEVPEGEDKPKRGRPRKSEDE